MGTAPTMTVTWTHDSQAYTFKSASYPNQLLYVEEGVHYTSANTYAPKIKVTYTLKGTALVTETLSSVLVSPKILPVRLRARFTNSDKTYDGVPASLKELLTVEVVDDGNTTVFAAEYNKTNSYFGSAYPGLKLGTATHVFTPALSGFASGDEGFSESILNAGRYTISGLTLEQSGSALANKNYVWDSMVTANPSDSTKWHNLTTDSISFEIHAAEAHIYVWSASREYGTLTSGMTVEVDTTSPSSVTANFADGKRHISVTGLKEALKTDPANNKSAFVSSLSEPASANSSATGFYDLTFDLSVAMEFYRNNYSFSVTGLQQGGSGIHSDYGEIMPSQSGEVYTFAAGRRSTGEDTEAAKDAYDAQTVGNKTFGEDIGLRKKITPAEYNALEEAEKAQFSYVEAGDFYRSNYYVYGMFRVVPKALTLTLTTENAPFDGSPHGVLVTVHGLAAGLNFEEFYSDFSNNVDKARIFCKGIYNGFAVNTFFEFFKKFNKNRILSITTIW